MRWLILGGTRFLGRHLAGMALARGDAVTLVHRGRQRENLFPQADHRIGDRTSELERLLGGPGGPTWDAVIDTSAYFPRQVSSAARVLAGRVGHYTLVSTISVYGEIDTPGIDETAPTPAPAAPTVEEVTGDTYGPLKAACEQAAQAGFAGRTLVVRPGLIVGPHDPSGRFTWWLQRVQRGGELLAPGRPDDAVQFIDARDLAGWMLQMAGRRAVGTFNATGPMPATTMGQLLHTARQALNPAARLRWVDDATLLAAGIRPWTELPLWLPGRQRALHQVDIGRALASGLRFRPLVDTVRDTAAWALHAAPVVEGIGLDAEREQALWTTGPGSAGR
jgi:2'-hydroxyisoflavone reductase